MPGRPGDHAAHAPHGGEPSTGKMSYVVDLRWPAGQASPFPPQHLADHLLLSFQLHGAGRFHRSPRLRGGLVAADVRSSQGATMPARKTREDRRAISTKRAAARKHAANSPWAIVRRPTMVCSRSFRPAEVASGTNTVLSFARDRSEVALLRVESQRSCSCWSFGKLRKRQGVSAKINACRLQCP